MNVILNPLSKLLYKLMLYMNKSLMCTAGIVNKSFSDLDSFSAEKVVNCLGLDDCIGNDSEDELYQAASTKYDGLKVTLHMFAVVEFLHTRR